MDTSITIKEQYSRKQLKEQANTLAKTVKNPAKAWATLCRFEDLAKYAKKEIESLVFEEIEKVEEEDSITQDGVTVSAEAGRVSWDFSQNPDWVELKNRITELEGNMKKVAKSVGIVIINEETGEQIPPAIRRIGKPFLKSSY